MLGWFGKVSGRLGLALVLVEDGRIQVVLARNSEASLQGVVLPTGGAFMWKKKGLYGLHELITVEVETKGRGTSPR